MSNIDQSTSTMKVFDENCNKAEVKTETIEDYILDFSEENCLYSIKEKSTTNHLVQDGNSMICGMIPIKDEVTYGTLKIKTEDKVSSRFKCLRTIVIT